MKNDLVEQLRKAGIKASLVSRIHDSEVIEISQEQSFEDMMSRIDTVMLKNYTTEDVEAAIRMYKPEKIDPVVIPYTSPVVMDYSQLELRAFAHLLKGSGVGYEEITKRARQKSFMDMYGNTTEGYVETLSGSRRYLRRKPTLDNNDTLR